MPISIDDIRYCQKCGMPVGMRGGCTCKGVVDCPVCGRQVSSRNFDKSKQLCDNCAQMEADNG